MLFEMGRTFQNTLPCVSSVSLQNTGIRPLSIRRRIPGWDLKKLEYCFGLYVRPVIGHTPRKLPVSGVPVPQSPVSSHIKLCYFIIYCLFFQEKSSCLYVELFNFFSLFFVNFAQKQPFFWILRAFASVFLRFFGFVNKLFTILSYNLPEISVYLRDFYEESVNKT